MSNLFKNNDLNKHIEEEKEKAKLEKNNSSVVETVIEVKEEKKEKNNTKKPIKKGSVKGIVESYLKTKNIKYSDWLEEKHNEILREIIEKDLLQIKEEK